MFATTKLATAAVTGVLSLAVTGAAAFAAFQPAARASIASSVEGPSAALQAERKGPADHIKDILDKLVQNGTITQAQEEAILKAFREAADRDSGGERHLKRILGDLMKLSADYLGLDKEQLGAQLKAGKSLGEIANATSGKSREGLIAYDVAQLSAQLDNAVAEGKITKEQADKAKSHLVERVTAFVDHKFEHKPGKREGERKDTTKPAPAKPTPTPST